MDNSEDIVILDGAMGTQLRARVALGDQHCRRILRHQSGLYRSPQ